MTMFPPIRRISLLPLCLLLACSRQAGTGDPADGYATASTIAANAAAVADISLSAAQDAEEARRGLIARPQGRILGGNGEVLVDFSAFGFIRGPAPQTVHPSLWRHAGLNAQSGLFRITDGIYQVRGFDIANMGLIEGRTGWIVVDPLTSRESAAAALVFARRHLGERPVSAIIFTHSHIDHFGGVLGVLSAEEAARRKVPVVAPEGFLAEATSENVMVGAAMGRRSFYQFGKNLPRSATGLVDNGLGKAVAYGSYGILPPTITVSSPIQALTVDGVDFVFHNVPGAEAPAELTFSIPSRKAYFGAEILAQTQHNLLPVRGAKVRDALKWSAYLDQALTHAADAEVYVGQHNWPVWGKARIAEFIGKQRDVYKYLHDQTVRLINAGYTPDEIAETVRLPPSLASYFAVRGYYGDVRHNVKAIYQHYLGAYDGNPAHLDPLPRRAAAARYVALAGGRDKLMAAAREAFERGEYRWAAELLNHQVFADADADAKRLLARTYEQLGYQSESSTWRNSYLTAAQELRDGPPGKGVSRADFLEVLRHTPTERFLEAMAAGLDGPSADGVELTVNLRLSDTGESYVLWIENAVLHHRKGAPDSAADAGLSLPKELFIRMMAGTADGKDLLLDERVDIRGSRLDLIRFFGLIDKAPGNFAIVTD